MILLSYLMANEAVEKSSQHRMTVPSRDFDDRDSGILPDSPIKTHRPFAVPREAVAADRPPPSGR
jgi:hypothetical protein